MAFRTLPVFVIVIGPEYNVEDSVGSVPSNVYKNLALGFQPEDNETDTCDSKSPPLGEIVGGYALIIRGLVAAI
jgi:hypothetical protein